MKKRTFMSVAALCLMVPMMAVAETRPTRILVGSVVGGPSDILARILATTLSKQMGRTFIVENKPGAGGAIAMEMLTRARPDGETLMIAAQPDLAILPAIKKLPYDPEKDVELITSLASQHNVLVVNSALGIKTLGEFAARAKASPGSITFGGGVGSPTHVLPIMYAQAAGITLKHIPYKGAGAALTDLVGGHIDCMFIGIPAAKQAIASGRVTALAVTGTTRSSVIPTVPTFSEAGMRNPDFNDGFSWTLIAPAALPESLAAQLAKAWAEAVLRPEVSSALEGQDLHALAVSGSGLAAMVARDRQKWSRVVKAAGITAE